MVAFKNIWRPRGGDNTATFKQIEFPPKRIKRFKDKPHSQAKKIYFEVEKIKLKKILKIECFLLGYRKEQKIRKKFFVIEDNRLKREKHSKLAEKKQH